MRSNQSVSQKVKQRKAFIEELKMSSLPSSSNKSSHSHRGCCCCFCCKSSSLTEKNFQHRQPAAKQYKTQTQTHQLQLQLTDWLSNSDWDSSNKLLSGKQTQATVALGNREGEREKMRKENTEKRGWQRRRDKQESREKEIVCCTLWEGACGSDLQCDTGKAVVIVSIVKYKIAAGRQS